jgi:hypothetical protein
VCLSRCGPTGGIPARTHAAWITPLIASPDIGPAGASTFKNSVRDSLGPRRRKYETSASPRSQGKWQQVIPAALAMDQQLAAAPVDVLERDRGDLAGAQPEPRQQQQDRVIAPTDRPPPVTARQKLLDNHRLKPARQRPVAQISDPRHRPLKRQLDQPSDMQIAQHNNQGPRPGRRSAADTPAQGMR